MHREQPVPAVDLGGTYAKGALVSADGTLLWRERIDTMADAGYPTVIEKVTQFLARLMDKAKAEYNWAGGPVGLATCGLVDDKRGVAVFSANLGWRELPLAASLSQQLGTQVVLSHDVTAGGVAEARLGAGRGAGTVLVVPIGTGIAAALIHQGQPFRGAHYAAMEIGHLPTSFGQEVCGCGATGCLETVASASAIARRYRQLTGQEDPTIDAKQVKELAESGHLTAIEIWDQARFALADAITALTIVLDPDRIVLAGGLSNAGQSLLQPIAHRIAQQVRFHPPPQVITARLGSWAGVVGAALLAGDAAAKPVN